MKKAGVLSILMMLLSAGLYAQRFGGNPSSVQWVQINTEEARIIFPRGLESRAQKTARMIQILQSNYAKTIGEKKKKIDIVLHNQTMISNGYVGLAPYRSEFYLTPPQHPFDLGAADWADQLAIHEFRHVQQYNNFNKGLSKLGSIVLGEQGQSVLNAAAIPDWFFEGDAVFSETQLTMQGRGVLPLFTSSYRAVHNAGFHFSYPQMRNGSLRKYVPDHYDLGYLLVAYGRVQYGKNIWQGITSDAARFTSILYPFQGAVKKHTGISFSRFVNNAMQYYRSQWQQKSIETPEWLTSTEKNNVVDYKYPYMAPDGAIIVLKSSYNNVPAFYKIYPGGREEKIAVRDIAITDYFSYNNGKIVYAAFRPDTRWGFRENSAIKIVDLATREEKTIAVKGKYFSPDISHDGQKIIAVSVNDQMQSSLIVMNREGQSIDSIQAEGFFFSNPKFSADGRHYYTIARNEAGEMSLMKYGDNDTAEILLPFANRLIGYLAVQQDTLLFTQSNNGRDEIWALTDGKQRKGPFRLALYATGLYQGCLLPGGKLVSAAFTADGYRLAMYTPEWKQTETGMLAPLYTAGAFIKEDHKALQERLLQSRQLPFSVTKYKKVFRLLNFHSWRPYYDDPEYSFTLFGENILNTLHSEPSYTYNENENSHRISYKGIFGGSYLQPVFGYSHTWNRMGRYNKDTLLHWNEQTGYAGLQLPLNLSGGRQYRYLNLSATYNINDVSLTGIGKSLLPNRQVHYISSRVSYTGQVQKALQQIYPRWAHTAALQYRTSVNYQARQLLVTGSLYLPGLSGNHSLAFSAAYQSRDTMNRYIFPNSFPFARGYSTVDFPRMWRVSANYHLPIAYPDWGFGQIVYVLRVRANLFFDYCIGKSLRTGIHTPFHTPGAELYFDTRWWNQHPLTFGIRYSRLNEFSRPTRPDVWEFIIPIGLF